MIDPLPLLAVRFGVGLLFLAAAAHKLAGHRRFGEALEAYRVFGPAVGPLSLATPVVEFVIGAAALAPTRALFAPAMVGAAVLLVAYAGLVIRTIRVGRRRIDCGCLGFGARRRELSAAMAVRNLVLAAVALSGLLPANARPLGWLDAVQLAFALLGVTLLYGAAELATALPSRYPT